MALGIAAMNSFAQADGPRGLFKMTEVIHRDGKSVVPDFTQYKYCNDNGTLQIQHNNYDPFSSFELVFSMRNVDGHPLHYTGSLSETEDKGEQIIPIDSTSFMLRWFSQMQNNYMFPYQQNIDERYVLNADKKNDVKIAFDLLNMKLGKKQSRLQGVWKLRGVQSQNRANSQYWVEETREQIYRVFGDSSDLTIQLDDNFPYSSAIVSVRPCEHKGENAFESDYKINIVNWFDKNTISTISYANDGKLMVLVWDRCNLPRNIQDFMGTNEPIMEKDITAYGVNSFKAKYGEKPDSIKSSFESFDFLVKCNENNNAIFPYLIEGGMGKEYKEMTQSLYDKVLSGEMNDDEACGRYVFWFNNHFDRHTSISAHTFSKLVDEEDRNTQAAKIKEYSPKPMACKLDNETYFVRIPSCSGDYPTWDWVKEKFEEFKASKCPYLIIDVRHNVGGSDGLGRQFYTQLTDTEQKFDNNNMLRNSFDNMERIKTFKRIFNKRGQSGSLADNILSQEDSEEQFLTWSEKQKGTVPDILEHQRNGEKPLIKRGAVIMDSGTGSAGESYIHWVKLYSNKIAKVYGNENSWGGEKTGNVNVIKIPNTNMEFVYPISCEDRIREACKTRKTGWAPDVIIPLPVPEKLTDNIDDWVLWVAKKMK